MKRSLALLVGGLVLAIAGSACGGGNSLSTSFTPTPSVNQANVVVVIAPPSHLENGTQQPTQVALVTTPTATPTQAQPPAPVKTSAPPPAPPQTVNGMQHRGPGAFQAGEAVIGYEITIGGLKYRQCYFSSAPDNGSVADGVVNPWPGEIIYSACKAGVQDPDTVNGMARRGPGTFQAGEAVVGFEITIGGLKYRLCYMASATGNGTVADGVINPYKAEVKYPPCQAGVQDPDTVNGMARRGPGAFQAGEAVTGYFTINGVSYGNCFYQSAPASGTVTDGVVNPWKKEVVGVRVCS